MGMKRNKIWVGRKHTEKTKRKMGESKLGDKNPSWKGNEVKYAGLHQWIKSRKPKTELCENCNKKKPIDLANISGEYRRDVNDFEWLCKYCHMKKDGIIKMLGEIAKKRRRKHKRILVECCKCHKFLSKSDFYKDNNHWDGLNKNCKNCRSKQELEWRKIRCGTQ